MQRVTKQSYKLRKGEFSTPERRLIVCQQKGMIEVQFSKILVEDAADDRAAHHFSGAVTI